MQGGKCGSALHAACFQLRLDIIQILLESGADPNVQGEGIWHPLMQLCLDFGFTLAPGEPTILRKTLEEGKVSVSQFRRGRIADIAALLRQYGAEDHGGEPLGLTP